MAKDVSDTVRNALGHVVREALKNVGDSPTPNKKSGPLSGVRGLAAGAGLAALAPLAVKGLSRANPGDLAGKAASKAGDRISSGVKDKVDEAGGAGGIAKQAASGLIPGMGGGDDDGDSDGMPGVGKNRRMPIQQSVDVAVPLETAYNQWTQYEDWPQFMHRVTRVTQEDETAVSFATKICGKTKEFKAEIVTQRPDDRVKWRVSEGITHTGVVSFHELAPRLTRIELDLDVDPGSLIEKAARGMRHIKRAVRADLHRYKAFIEMQEHESGAWRGRIENGEVVEEHDESYDKDREYSEVDDIFDYGSGESDDDGGDDDERGNGNGSNPDRRKRFERQAQAKRSGGSSRSSGGNRSSSRSGSSRSGSSSGGSSKSGTRKQSSSSSSRSSSGSSKSKSGGSSSRRKTASRS